MATQLTITAVNYIMCMLVFPQENGCMAFNRGSAGSLQRGAVSPQIFDLRCLLSELVCDVELSHKTHDYALYH